MVMMGSVKFFYCNTIYVCTLLSKTIIITSFLRILRSYYAKLTNGGNALHIFNYQFTYYLSVSKEKILHIVFFSYGFRRHLFSIKSEIICNIFIEQQENDVLCLNSEGVFALLFGQIYLHWRYYGIRHLKSTLKCQHTVAIPQLARINFKNYATPYGTSTRKV